MRASGLWTATLLMVAVVGCASRVGGSATDSDSSTTDDSSGSASSAGETGSDAFPDCRRGFDELKLRAEYDCACEVAAGMYPDKTTCLVALYPWDSECECSILASDPINATVLECLLDVEKSFSLCWLSVACEDFQPGFDCVQDYVQGRLGCGPLSKSSLGDVALMCRGLEAFTCVDGEVIFWEYKCDGEVDCADMSDETTCG